MQDVCNFTGAFMLQLVEEASRFVDSEENLLSIKRDKSHKIQTYLKKALPKIKSFDFSITKPDDIDAMRSEAGKLLPDLGDADEKKLFVEDMVDLCKFFQKTAEGKSLNVRLQVVSDNMCRLFHEDNIHQRLLCTYLGPGTELIQEPFVNRKRLGKGNNRRVVLDWNKVRQAENFEVIVLRGKLFKGLKKGAIHRSPPLKSSTDQRLLLKIDEI